VNERFEIFKTSRWGKLNVMLLEPFWKFRGRSSLKDQRPAFNDLERNLDNRIVFYRVLLSPCVEQRDGFSDEEHC
jgi:hypothetical protein